MSKGRDIKININGLTLRLCIPEEKEQVYREAAKLLNKRIDKYNHKFRLAYTDILTMIAYEMAVNAVGLENNYSSTPLSVMECLASQIKNELDSEKSEEEEL